MKNLAGSIGCALSLLLLASGSVYAQPASPRNGAGWGRAGLKLGPSTVAISNTRIFELSQATRWEAGAMVRLELLPWLDYQPELFYENRNYTLISEDNFEFAQLDYHYMTINWIHARFHLPYQWVVDPYLSLGLVKTGYLVTAESEDENGLRTEEKSRSNHIDVGSVNVSVGVEFAFTNGGKLGLEVRFEEGWRDIDQVSGNWHKGLGFLFSYHLPLAPRATR